MKLILEILPLLVFFICYKIFGIIDATLGVIFATSISVSLYYFTFKKVPKAMLISLVLVLISGTATIASGNSNFIKMKPTALYIIMASILSYGLYTKKSYIKVLFGNVFVMHDKAWMILSRRFIYFFLTMAFANEMIWRFFSESTWVSFKVFGAIPCVLVFILFQLPLINKHSEKKF